MRICVKPAMAVQACGARVVVQACGVRCEVRAMVWCGVVCYGMLWYGMV